MISPHKAVPLLALCLSIKGTTIYPVLEVRILHIIFATFCHFLHFKYLSIIYFICLSTMTVLLPYAKLLLSLNWADAKVSKLFFLCPLMSLTLHPHAHTKLFSSQRTRISFWKCETDHDSTLNSSLAVNCSLVKINHLNMTWRICNDRSPIYFSRLFLSHFIPHILSSS